MCAIGRRLNRNDWSFIYFFIEARVRAMHVRNHHKGLSNDAKDM